MYVLRCAKIAYKNLTMITAQHSSRYIFFCIALFMSQTLTAQTGVTLKFKKSKQVQLLTYERLYDPNNTKTSRNKLRKRSDFTDAEVEEIFQRLDKDELLPRGLNNNGDKTKLQHYVAYQLSDFNLLGYGFSLIWIPYEDNQHMPSSMQPPTKDGCIFYTYTKHLSFNTRDMALAGTPVGSGQQQTVINTSVADMSQFLNNSGSSSGTGKHQGFDRKSLQNSNSQLAAQALNDFDKLLPRLQQLDAEYDVEVQKILKQIEKDNKSGVRANLFMKKERATAQAKLDEVHKLIRDYLKKYNSILSEDNKEKLRSWDEAAPLVVPV